MDLPSMLWQRVTWITSPCVNTKCGLNTLPQKSLATSLLCAWRSHSRNSTNTSRLTVTCQSPRVGSKSALGSKRTSKLLSNGLVTSCNSAMSHQLLPFPLIASLTSFVATRHLRKVMDGSAGKHDGGERMRNKC